MEEGINNRNDDTNEKWYGGGMAEFPDDTSPAVIEEIVSDINYDKNENYDEMQNAHMTLLQLICIGSVITN